jgi:hypothetical protein
MQFIVALITDATLAQQCAPKKKVTSNHITATKIYVMQREKKKSLFIL